MALIDDGKVIIEVGLNEMPSKQENPDVPYGWQEVARDTVECAAAGAGIVHFHARYDDGTQAKTDDEIYRRGDGHDRRVIGHPDLPHLLPPWAATYGKQPSSPTTGR
jgi:hypothetical protein